MTQKKSTRREYGSGSISRNNKIKRYTATWTDETGKRHSCSKFPMDNEGKQQAKEFLRKIIEIRDSGFPTTGQEILGEWIIRFLKTKKNTVQDTTLERYKQSAQMLPDALLETPIDCITEDKIQELYEKLLEHYKASTIHNLHSILTGTFKLASKRHKLRYNIMPNIEKPRKQRKKIDVYTPQEIGKILQYIRKDMEKEKETCLLLVRLLHDTGMRIGEALALRWQDIDLKNEEIHIHENLTNRGTFHETKTEAGTRTIPILSQKTIKILKEKSKIPAIFVFEAENGQPIPKSRIQYLWKKIRKNTGINKTLHIWRHTIVTTLIHRDIDIAEISRFIGHSDTSVTARIYTHSSAKYNRHLRDQYRKRSPWNNKDN